MMCAKCRAEASPSATLCRSCGNPFPPAAPSSREETATLLPSAYDGMPTVLPAPVNASQLPAGSDAAATLLPSTEEGATGIDGFAAPGSAPGARVTGETGPLSPGESFGPRYHIISLIGLGGMGAVYQAWDAELGVVVALKVIRPEAAADPAAARDMERRFKRELLLARQVTHRNVVRIHDLGELNGIKYITMPFLQGRDLATILSGEERLEVARALKIARSVLAGLAAAHQAGVVHRDLKPANIMIGDDDQALIMDFGIARSTGDAASAARAGSFAAHAEEGLAAGATSAGEIVGTIEYMAPEQARGEPADQRADIYAFGLILYDMLLGGRRHTRAESAIAELRSRVAAPPPAPRTLDARIPDALDRIVARCIAPAPGDRFQATAELVAAFDRLDDNGRPLPSGRRVIHGVVAGAVTLVLAMFVLTWWLARPRPAAPPHEAVQLLIADFQNPTRDPVFEGTLEHALGVAVEGAPFITSYDRNAAHKVAARLKPGSTLDASMARLVAVREGIKVVLAGAIEGGDDGGYSVTLRAVSSSDGRQLWGAKTRVASKDKVLTAVGTLASDLRKALGDTSSRAERLAPAETFSTASLEALRDYTKAQELSTAGRNEEAIALYRSAVARDPKFGRAYSGWATAAFYLGRKEEAAEKHKKALSLMDRMTEREKYRSMGGYFFVVVRNYEKAIENYQTLVRLYPTDSVGYNNLAFAYFNVLDFAKALEAGERAHRLYPKNAVIGNNYALYAMYAGNFGAAAGQARQLVEQEPGFFKNYLPLAVAALADDKFDAARAAYDRMAATGLAGASVASMGAADIEMYTGQWSEAERVLKAGIAADEQSKQTEAAAVKYVALAEVYEGEGHAALALRAVRRALEVGHEVATLVPAARLFVRQKQLAEARAIAGRLKAQLEPQSRAYGRIIEGDLATESGQFADAIDAYRAAIKLADVWLARFAMGVAYVEAGHEAEGLAELEACLRRRGEATALFLDDTPSFRALAALPYWLGRAQEGVGQQSAALANYKKYLALRGAIPRDPLVKDAMARSR